MYPRSPVLLLLLKWGMVGLWGLVIIMADNKTQILKEYLRNFTTLKGIVISDVDRNGVVPLYHTFSEAEN